MKDLREYLNEGIFDITADDVDKALCINAFQLLTKPLKFSGTEIEQAFASGDIGMDFDSKCLNIRGLANQVFVNKEFVNRYGDMIKCINLEYYTTQSSKINRINFLSDLDGVDCGGMEFRGFKFGLEKGTKLVNAKLCCLSNTEQMFLLNRFDKVDISINDKIENGNEFQEFDNKKFPKLTFVQEEKDQSNIFDGVTLIGSSSCKFNVSLACTAVGREIRKAAKNNIPDFGYRLYIKSTDAAKIDSLLKSSKKSIAQVDYMYERSEGTDSGEGFMYSPESKSIIIRRLNNYSSDYRMALNLQGRNSIHDFSDM